MFSALSPGGMHLHSGEQAFQQDIVAFSANNRPDKTAVIFAHILSYRQVLASDLSSDHCY